ncbi:Nramp family divalent metal transporter [Winogradskya consettensis]|uniref:Divalent metal cation transporter MntH n=1 Tax=Winogradskya consettensis TaxID=113560 RepID=A0A919VLS4_9ACTN|nr:Nramp family divalent metal transporter [Actinoplanes consettensis]GIM67997.1 divalent metal cation transporter MntH [Actinoplanes consettensis]
MTRTSPSPLITEPLPGRLTPAAKNLRIATALGPAFVAAIAYLDPGNFATNFAAGSSTGYRLVWVVVLANVVAMPIQYLAAKLGIVTGQSLPQLCRATMGRRSRWVMWGQAEIVAMATDLAEFVGAAIGLNLLFGMPLPLAAVITAVLAFAILAFQRRGHRPFELAVGAMLALICAGFLYTTLRIPPSATGVLGGLVPNFAGDDTLLLAVGIIGATVMPHAIYLHSGLMSNRVGVAGDTCRTKMLHFARVDIGIAMGIAGLVNLSMLAVAAKLFYAGPGTPAIGLGEVHNRFAETIGGSVALAFAAALLASGISSSSVGTAAGQIIMDGFLNLRIATWLRRAITMTPAVVLLMSGLDPTKALVLSQVTLSFGIPFALGALLWLTSRRDIMGEHVNTRTMTAGMAAVVAVLSGLNLMLLGQQLTTWLT